MKTPGRWIVLNTLFAFAFFNQSPAQPLNLSGTWTGRLGQEDKGWFFEMTLTLIQNKNIISGTSKIVSLDGNKTYAVHAIKGTLNGKKLRFSDLTVEQEYNLSPYTYWCKKMYSGKIRIGNDSLILSGVWENDGRKVFRNQQLIENSMAYCYPGTFRLSRVREDNNGGKAWTDSLPPEKELIRGQPFMQKDTAGNSFLERKVKVLKVVDVISDSVKLTLYDNGEIDNDTVSIYYNRTLLLNRKRVSEKPAELKIAVPPGRDNELLLYADNEGSIPPNTVLLILTDNGIRKEIRIDSDTKESGTIILRRTIKH